MDKEFKAGTTFGIGLILIWLTLLTGFIMYGKIVEGGKGGTVILPPPPLEVIEIEIEGADYDLQSNF